jgi:Cytochrome c554 and c-prime
MPMNPCRVPVLAAAVVGLALLAWWAGGGRGQAPKADAGKEADKGPTTLYFGISECARCHTMPGKVDPDDPDLCRLTESKIWDAEDKHRQAFRVLKGERAQKMGKLLHIDVTKDKQCLSCHGVVVPEGAAVHKSFKEDDGVSCVVCHGAAEEWVDMHGGLRRDKWRKLTREEKDSKYGMTDLWDPVKRANLCTSCHVGNVENKAAGKFVTHDMYAAGHPPLPGFEASTFSNEMPRHWQYLSEKDPKIQPLLQYDPKDLEQSKLLLVGAAASFRQAAELLADEAKQCAEARDADKAALDLAQFDCYACHHELKAPSWRQKRGYVGRPGRPQMRPWPEVLLRLAVVHAGADEKEFEQVQRKVAQAFDARPFGDPRQVADTAKEMAAWAKDIAQKVDRKPCGPAEVRRARDQLLERYQKEVVDYDSARQIAWAISVFNYDLGEKLGPDARKVLKALDDDLNLQLPSGQFRQLEDLLAGNLKLRNNYDPEKFQAALAQLSTLLAKQ